MFRAMHRMSGLCLALCSSLILSGCATAPTSSSVDSHPSSDRFNKALAHYSQGLLHEMDQELAEANQSYEKAIELDPDHRDSYLRTAFNYIRLRDPDQAMAVIDRLVTVDPKSPDSHLWKAKVCVAADQLDAAEAAYHTALELDRTSLAAYVELTTLLLSQNRDDEAIQILGKGIDNVDDPSLLLGHLGNIYLKRANLSGDQDAVIRYQDQAVILYEQALKKRPDDTKLLQQLGDIYVVNKKMEDAIRIFSRLVPLIPDDPQPRQRLALALIASGKQEQAVQTLEQLVNQDPANPRVYFYLGELYQQLGDKKNAILNFRLATKAGEAPMAAAYAKLALLEIDADDAHAEQTLIEATDALPGDIQLHEMFAYYYLNRKQYADAVPVFKTTAKLFSRQGITPQPNFYLYYALALQFSGELEEAARELQSGIKTTPELLDAYAQFTLQEQDADARADGLNMMQELAERLDDAVPIYTYIGLIHNRNEDYEQAITAFQKAGELAELADHDADPLPASYYFWFGAARERLKQFEEAEVLFEKCIEANENHAEAYNYLAYMWAERGINLDKAELYIGKAMSIVPENGAFLDTAGWIFYQRGQYQIARVHIEQAAALIPEDPTIIEHLGDIALKQKRKSAAIKYWTQALEKMPENQPLREKLIAQGVELAPLTPATTVTPDTPGLEEVDVEAQHEPDTLIQDANAEEPASLDMEMPTEVSPEDAAPAPASDADSEAPDESIPTPVDE